MKKKNIEGAVVAAILFLSIFSSESVADQHKPDIKNVYNKEGSSIWKSVLNKIFPKETHQNAKSFAVVIGIGDYEKGWTPLEAPFQDAMRVKKYLIEQAGFDYVVTLTNKEASKRNIEHYMENVLPKKIGPNDRVLFYFSGHGTQRTIKTRQGEIVRGYLPMPDSEKDGWASMISMNELEVWYRNIQQSRHVLFLLDSCFSGLAGVQSKGKAKDLYLDDLWRPGHNLISAGNANEISYAHMTEWGGSLFTDSFLKGIQGAADSGSDSYGKDGVVSLTELMTFYGKILMSHR